MPTPPMTLAERRVIARRWPIDLYRLRPIAAAMIALGIVLPHLPHDVGLPCPLRTLTGVPCPLCGLTTSVKAVCAGRLHDAVLANPFGLLAVLMAVLLIMRPSWRQASVPVWAVAGAAMTSWFWQLHRFHWL